MLYSKKLIYSFFMQHAKNTQIQSGLLFYFECIFSYLLNLFIYYYYFIVTPELNESNLQKHSYRSCVCLSIRAETHIYEGIIVCCVFSYVLIVCTKVCIYCFIDLVTTAGNSKQNTVCEYALCSLLCSYVEAKKKEEKD